MLFPSTPLDTRQLRPQNTIELPLRKHVECADSKAGGGNLSSCNSYTRSSRTESHQDEWKWISSCRERGLSKGEHIPFLAEHHWSVIPADIVGLFLISTGYGRIVLAFASLYYMPLHPRTCSILYSISCLLDALDGYAARYFEQSTRFGAVLDMVTDRCTTACLLVFLSSAWPRWAIVFQGLISLDLASHYVHMYATLIMGGSDTSHKKVDKSRSFILNLYYTNKVRRPWLYTAGVF